MTDTIEDPFAANNDVDDPFASAADVQTARGPFVPWPTSIEPLVERLVVIVPRTHDKEAKVSEHLQKKFGMPATREEWKVDLIVLDGGTLTYPYAKKVEKDGNTTFEDAEHTVDASELPFMIPGYKVVWGNILGAINKVAGNAKPMLIGRIRAGYSVADMRKGKTFEDFAAEMNAWIEKAKKDPAKAGDKPKAKWHFEVTENDADRAKARAWWAEARENGFTF